MSIKIGVEMVGMPELEQALKQLRAEMGGKEGNIMSNALRATSKDVQRKMVFLAPMSKSNQGSHIDWHRSKNGKWVHGGENGERAKPGRLRRSIFWKRDPRPRHLSELYHIGPKFGKSRNDPDGAWYAAIVNFKGGEGGQGKGFMSKAITPEFHTRMIQFELARQILPKARKIGAENASKVAAAVKKANAAFAYKK